MAVSRGFHRRRVAADTSRVPPGQYVTADYPVLSAGPTPHTPLADWTFTIRGETSQPVSWTWDQPCRLRDRCIGPHRHGRVVMTSPAVSPAALARSAWRRGRLAGRVSGSC